MQADAAITQLRGKKRVHKHKAFVSRQHHTSAGQQYTAAKRKATATATGTAANPCGECSTHCHSNMCRLSQRAPA